ncbi:MAG: squalene synthase HpnC [Chloroflexi bacterium]|nr:squalene synthase HpnC [Chloroflexota bacterium]
MEPLLAGHPKSCSVLEAFAQCEQLARTHYENFTVVSWLLPPDKRKHLYAIYAFCRFVDDLGDELHRDRLHLLDLWHQDLLRCYQTTPLHPYMIALQETIYTFSIPIHPFLKLLEANRMDQTQKRYLTYKDLEYYCQHSANPVGHLVLYVLGYRDDHRQRLSDYTCTALQLTNFWQDVSRDMDMGRIYIPLEDMERFGYCQEELLGRVVNEPFRHLMAFEVDRTFELFRQGLKLVDMVDNRLKLDITLFSLGGMRILKAIERQNYDVLSRRPTLSKGAKLSLILSTMVKLWIKRRV